MRQIAGADIAGASLRLDKWLWFARLARSRALAARLCEKGRVRIGEARAQKPHHPVRVGDWITVEQGDLRRRLCVKALGQRRGPAVEARLLYDEPEPPRRLTPQAWTPLLDEDFPE